MVVRTYGDIMLAEHHGKPSWQIFNAEPHVCVKLKNMFPMLGKTTTQPYFFENTIENCHDLLWFMDRYPLAVSEEDREGLMAGRKGYISRVNELEAILLTNYEPNATLGLREGEEARNYQAVGKDIYMKVNRVLIGDDLGLGKTMISIIASLEPNMLPSAVVVQSHLAIQWMEEYKAFTYLNIHIVKTRKPYSLPPADIYIFKYSNVSGWTDVFATKYIKSCTFDEVQELRHPGTDKYIACSILSNNVERALGLSATPIYNYGNEIYNVLNLLKPGCLGEFYDFYRAWMIDAKRVGDPQALGAYLREQMLMVRRTRADVGMELPAVNKIIQYIGYDEKEVKKSEKLAIDLALSVMTGSFEESGQAARKLDALLRQITGVSKARYVAEYVKMLCHDGLSIVLGAWHREVYDILLKELAEFNPVMYSGSETERQKDISKKAFIAKQSQILLLSLRSGAGMDGLQEVCDTTVLAELDWSPKVHDQFIGRVDRPGQKNPPVNAIFCVSTYGSDPVIMNRLGIKASQSHGIMDPMLSAGVQESDDSKIKALAKSFLESRNKKV